MSSIEEQVDARLLALELRVGLAAMTETKVPDSDNDIAARIDLLEQSGSLRPLPHSTKLATHQTNCSMIYIQVLA
jgi:hypothetical protein